MVLGGSIVDYNSGSIVDYILQTKRTLHPVIFKTKNKTNKSDKTILLGLDITGLFSDPKRIDELVNFLKTSLENLDTTPSASTDVLINST